VVAETLVSLAVAIIGFVLQFQQQAKGACEAVTPASKRRLLQQANINSGHELLQPS
jgi:hypothetical protein